MSAGMRSPKLGQQTRGIRVAAAWAGFLALLLGLASPSAVDARTHRARKLLSKTSAVHKSASQSAQHKKRLKSRRSAKQQRVKPDVAHAARQTPSRSAGKSAKRAGQPNPPTRVSARNRAPGSKHAVQRRGTLHQKQVATSKARKTAKGTTPRQIARLDSKHRLRSTQRHPACQHCRGKKRHAPIHLARRPSDPSKLIIPEGDGPPTLDMAARLLGRPYRFGSDHGAYDCSGFVRTVFAAVGIELPHSAREQFTLGDRITRDDLEPGDLVFFGSKRRRFASHVGIYVGEDKFVHAATRAGQVQVDSLNESYYSRHYIGARRLEI